MSTHIPTPDRATRSAVTCTPTESAAHGGPVPEAPDGLDASLSAKVLHDLRQPLQAVLLALAVARDAPAGSRDRAVAVAERQARRAVDLLDELVAGIREHRSAFSVRRVVLDLRTVIDDIARSIEPAAAEAGVTFVADRPAEPLLVAGDADRLGQVLTNFLSNALRFTPRGGEIRMCAERAGAWAVLRVRDTGPGLRRTDLHRIFRSGHRSDHPGSFGIGLTIAREIVVAHGGTVAARSAGPGTGSEFRAILPRLRGHADDAPAHRAAPGKGPRRRVGLHPQAAADV
jgi:signal transduction histidine kinase